MTKNIGLLARLFGRAQNHAPVVSALYANAIGQPLLVHPQMGEQIVGGYLHGAVDARPPLLQECEIEPGAADPLTGVVTAGRSIAVLNISGPLVNRFEPGMCDPGPLSYESIRKAYDAALADASEAIVFRIESPGGMASGLFDLADRVASTRKSAGGPKRVIACIDDYAYSAAYGLASACDEIWITRTGGAGSVGVIAYHVDQSAWDAKVGVKVTAIYSGARKNDMSPHQPLSDSAAEWLQQRMDKMRQMFADGVARNRGISVDAVLATEAQVYQGEEAVAIGFADRIGTYHELIESIRAGEEDDDQADDPMSQPAAASASAGEAIVAQMMSDVQAAHAPALSAEYAAKRDRGIVADALASAGLPPTLTAALLAPSASVTPDTVGARIDHAKALADICAAAGLPDLAADYAAKNVEIETARAQLIAAKAEDGPELVTAHPAVKAVGARLDVAGIYERRKAQTP